MAGPKRKQNLSSVLSKPNKAKYKLPGSRLGDVKNILKRTAFGGVALGLTLFGAKAVKETVAQRNAERVEVQRVLRENPRLVRNPVWVRIREVAGLNPKNKKHLNLMLFVDEVSQKTGVAPDRVISTFLNYGKQGSKELPRLEQNLRYLEKSPRSEAANLKRQKRIVEVMEFSKDPRYKDFFKTLRDVPRIWAYK